MDYICRQKLKQNIKSLLKIYLIKRQNSKKKLIKQKGGKREGKKGIKIYLLKEQM